MRPTRATGSAFFVPNVSDSSGSACPRATCQLDGYRSLEAARRRPDAVMHQTRCFDASALQKIAVIEEVTAIHGGGEPLQVELPVLRPLGQDHKRLRTDRSPIGAVDPVGLRQERCPF